MDRNRWPETAGDTNWKEPGSQEEGLLATTLPVLQSRELRGTHFCTVCPQALSQEPLFAALVSGG